MVLPCHFFVCGQRSTVYGGVTFSRFPLLFFCHQLVWAEVPATLVVALAWTIGSTMLHKHTANPTKQKLLKHLRHTGIINLKSIALIRNDALKSYGKPLFVWLGILPPLFSILSLFFLASLVWLRSTIVSHWVGDHWISSTRWQKSPKGGAAHSTTPQKGGH